jgi:hypothetical protein
LDIGVSQEVGNRITYLIRTKGEDNEFFPNVLNDSGIPYFYNQTGMRGIQKNLILVMKADTEQLLDKMGVIR